MHKKGIITVSFVGVLALLGLVLNGSGVFATQTCTTDSQTGQVSCTNSTTASVTVSSACSFNTTRATGYDSENGYTAILANNASTEITGSTFTTICNDPGGYAIYAVGYGNNTLGETDLISANGSSNITTSGSPASGTSYWQMKLAANTLNQPSIDNGYSNYSAIPSTYTKVASYSSITDPASSGTRTGQPVTTYYKAYASATQPADTYTGAVKYTMVHPNTNIPDQPYNCTANKICYFPNAGNTVADTMGDQSIGSSDTSATLIASNFQRTGYGFAGWNTEYDGSGTFYGPNEDIEFEAGQYDGTGNHSAGLSLYAVWVESAGDLQNWNGCSSLTATSYDSTTGKIVADLSSVTALTDKRDNQTYAVARLADGNCWMIENLRLDAKYTRGGYYQGLAQGYGGVPGTYGSFIGLANSQNSGFSFSNTTANSIYKSDGTNSIYNPSTNPVTLEDIGVNDYPAYRMPRYNNTNTQSPASAPTGGVASIYSYGNYYSWAAAIANTTYYTTTSDSDAANTSICPKGWRLPFGASGTNVNLSFSKLDYSMGGSGENSYQDTIPTGADRAKIWRDFPNNFIYSGKIERSSIDGRGTDGFYWSSSAYFGAAYSLLVFSERLRPGTHTGEKYPGFTVRCVAIPSS